MIYLSLLCGKYYRFQFFFLTMSFFIGQTIYCFVFKPLPCSLSQSLQLLSTLIYVLDVFLMLYYDCYIEPEY